MHVCEGALSNQQNLNILKCRKDPWVYISMSFEEKCDYNTSLV